MPALILNITRDGVSYHESSGGQPITDNLKHLSDLLELSRNKKQSLLQAAEALKAMGRTLQKDFDDKKAELLQLHKQEAEVLNTRISETTAVVVDLEDKIREKEHGFIARLFTKEETVEKLRDELAFQSQKLTDLYLQRDDSQKPLTFSLEELQSFNNSNFFSKFKDQNAELESLLAEISANFKAQVELQARLDESSVHIKVNFDDQVSELYKKLADAFNKLRYSEKIWDITSETKNADFKSSANSFVSRREVIFDLRDFYLITCTEPAFHLQNANGDNFYIYPAFVVLLNTDGSFRLLAFDRIGLQFGIQKFIEELSTIPQDSKIIDYAWAKVNKDGSPDLRFKGNKQTPVVQYGELSFKLNGVENEIYQMSNFESAHEFAISLGNYLSFLEKGTLLA